MNLESWFYFLSIERDFVRTTDFVAVDHRNFKAFSNEYAKLLLLIGSEFDVVAKMLCDTISSGNGAKNIHQYAATILPRFLGIQDVEIDVQRYLLKRQPFRTWTVGSAPSWWAAYNDVKHHRDSRFEEANLENTLDALCGLFALLLYHYRSELSGSLQPYPELLDHGSPSHIVASGWKKPPGA